MRIAVTGGTGFLGRYIVSRLAEAGHELRLWYRPSSDRTGLDGLQQITWVEGDLGSRVAADELVKDCDAVVHAALYHPGGGFRGGEGDIGRFVEKNLLGTLELIEAARAAHVDRFIFISTCAVYEKIMDDRPLDEAHPLWPGSHYGAHKAAIEKFVHSYGIGRGYDICALRPTGIYGIAQPVDQSKWFDLVRSIVRGQDVRCSGGGKEVHASDVAKATELLLSAKNTAGQAYNCYDLYVSEFDVATFAKRVAESGSNILGEPRQPKHQIVVDKIKSLGMVFGGRPLLEETISQMVAEVKRL